MKHNILLVDDDRDLVVNLRDSLEFEEFNVDVAYDGEEGLKQWSCNPYDIIILDVRMPKMNGVAVLKSIKEKQPNTPIIIISGEISGDGSDDDKLKNMIHCHAFEFLEKPFDDEELIFIINEALESRSLVLKALEESVEESDNPNAKVYAMGNKDYSIQELYDEVRKGSEFGRDYFTSLEKTILYEEKRAIKDFKENKFKAGGIIKR